MTAQLKTQLGALVPASFRGARADRVVLAGARTRDAWAGLVAPLADGGTAAATLALASDVPWLLNDMLNDSLIPPDDIRSLVAALTEDA